MRMVNDIQPEIHDRDFNVRIATFCMTEPPMCYLVVAIYTNLKPLAIDHLKSLKKYP